ncbi:MAG: threonylcarbamoyl-AMP synthase [Bacteroidia bacterium]|nr:threonylcarbamoyl-AMP synthase [Bacteroidia bacterium]
MIIKDNLLAKQILEEGKLVAIPTETVYGLAANAFDGKAVAAIYQVKNRPQFNPLIIHSNSLKRFEEWGIFLPKEALLLAEKFSPGPITFVVKKSSKVPDIVSAGHDTVAIRIPNHAKTLSLLESLDFPLAAPSANLSGTVSPTTAEDVETQLGYAIAAVLDGGNCHVGLESTIISFAEGRPKLLRLGGLSLEKIEHVLNQTLDKTMLINNENPQAPGMLSRHYAPKTPLYIDAAVNHLKEAQYNEMAFIGFSQKHPKILGSNQIILSPKGDYAEAAQNLFAAIRKADALQMKLIIAELLPEENLGLAINDRLKRAAVK